MRKIYNRDRSRIERWDGAIPLGNAALGGLLFGDERMARLSLDSSSLWDLRRNENTLRDDFTFSELLALVKGGEKRNFELQDRFGKFFDQSPYPTKLPCAEIDFKLPEGTGTVYSFSMPEAIGRVLLSDGEKIEVFFDAVSFIGYLRYPDSIEFILTPPDYKSEAKRESLTVNCLCALGYPDGSITDEDGYTVYRQPMTDGMEYSVHIAKRKYEGHTEAVFTVKAPRDTRTDDNIKDALTDALDIGFDAAHSAHCEWWGEYLSATAVSLPPEDAALEELYELAHYLIGAGSRAGHPPMPLQGVWTGSEVGMLPPWKGDYHFDLNVQGTYNWAFRAGRVESIRPLIDYFKENYESIKSFSERFFELEGAFFIPGTADLSASVMGGWVQYTYSIGSALWMLLVLDRWYDFTEDVDFLGKFLIPALRGSFLLLRERFLTEVDGIYNITLSVSPEINDDKHSAWVKNSTYDVTVIREFLRTYIKRLASVGESTKDAEDVLARLVGESVSEEGYLLAEGMPLTVSHRHHSHCMDIFPFSRLDYRNGDELDIMRRTIRVLEERGTRMWIGFSFVWMGAIYAMAKDGESAVRILRIFADSFVSENGFHLNGDYKKHGHSAFTYRPFTLEGNGMLAEAVQEMLLQNHHGAIRLFPAIPKGWRCGTSFCGFMLDKNTRISAKIDEGGVRCVIENYGEKRAVTVEHEGDVRCVMLKKGKNEINFF